MIYASVLLGAYTMIGHAMFLGMDRSINWFDIKSQTERFGTRAKPLFEGIINNLTAITIFFRRQAEKCLGLLRIKLQKLTFSRNAINKISTFD